MSIHDYPSFDFQVFWRDLDSNNHVANSSYMDFNTQCRMFYLESAGFPFTDFERLNIGPVVLNDFMEYRKELFHQEHFKITISLGGINAKQTKFILCHRFVNEAGDICVNGRSLFVILDRGERKIITPPPHLLAALVTLPSDEVWEDL